jgi:hypothetical protein
MKRTPVIALFTMAVLSMIGVASAQDRAAQATVPFSFRVGDRVLPAATYQVSSPSRGVIKIQSLDGQTSVLTSYSPDLKDQETGSKLVFKRYGDQYFLHAVLCPSASVQASIPTWPQEKKTRLLQANPKSSGTITVALR